LWVFFSIWSGGHTSDPFAAAATSGSRGAKYQGLDFYEDPFKNSNYRYADPFDSSETSDPFFSKTIGDDDPFASVPQATSAGAVAADFSAAFGGDPFGGSDSGDPFSAAGADPFISSARTAGSGDPFAPPPSSSADPFGGGEARFDTSSADPFGNSFSGSVFSSSHNNNKLDSSFGVNSNAAFSNDPFR
jgi:hypothetical protein